MAWIESHTVVGRHRKVRQTALALRIRPAYLVGHLHLLWHAALEQQEDGDLSSWSDEFIADQSDFPGDAPQFVQLLQQHGLLDGKIIHDWLDYAGKYLTSKYSTSNVTRLREIWTKHGRIYGGKRQASGKREVSDEQANAPNTTDPPDQPTDHAPPPGASETDRNAWAQNRARCWISANLPTFLKSGVAPLSRLILRLGYGEAVRRTMECKADPNVGNPFSYLEAVLDNTHARNGARSQRRQTALREDG